jgi:hypothetical protein
VVDDGQLHAGHRIGRVDPSNPRWHDPGMTTTSEWRRR